MAIKLTAAERREHDQHIERLKQATEELSAAVAKDEHLTVKSPDTFVDLFNSAVSDINEFVVEVAERLREDFDDRSDNWQQGDKGIAADEMIQAWEDFTAEEADEDGEFEDLLEEFTQLPTEPNE